MPKPSAARFYLLSVARTVASAVLALSVGSVAIQQNAMAASLPSSPGNQWYVSPSWSYAGVRGRSQAYDYGWDAASNSSAGTGTGKFLVLEFGRQKSDPGQGWGVMPIGQSSYFTNNWAKQVAQDFIDGYYNKGGTSAKIVIATNNSNIVASNNNNVDWTLASTWQSAAGAWGSMLNSLIVRSNSSIWSGNDIEAWNEIGCSNCSGSNTVAWMQTLYSFYPSRSNLNFGSEAAVENSSTWTQDQVYQVSYGIPSAWVAPQVLCEKQPAQWQQIQTDLGKAMTFLSVVSHDYAIFNGQDVCVTDNPDPLREYTWQGSWDALWKALTDKTQLNSDVIVSH